MNLRHLRLVTLGGLFLGLFLPGLLGLLVFGASGLVYVVAAILSRKSRRPRDPYSVPEAIHPR